MSTTLLIVAFWGVMFTASSIAADVHMRRWIRMRRDTQRLMKRGRK